MRQASFIDQRRALAVRAKQLCRVSRWRCKLWCHGVLSCAGLTTQQQRVLTESAGFIEGKLSDSIGGDVGNLAGAVIGGAVVGDRFGGVVSGVTAFGAIKTFHLFNRKPKVTNEK